MASKEGFYFSYYRAWRDRDQIWLSVDGSALPIHQNDATRVAEMLLRLAHAAQSSDPEDRVHSTEEGDA